MYNVLRLHFLWLIHIQFKTLSGILYIRMLTNKILKISYLLINSNITFQQSKTFRRPHIISNFAGFFHYLLIRGPTLFQYFVLQNFKCPTQVSHDLCKEIRFRFLQTFRINTLFFLYLLLTACGS